MGHVAAKAGHGMALHGMTRQGSTRKHNEKKNKSQACILGATTTTTTTTNDDDAGTSGPRQSCTGAEELCFGHYMWTGAWID
jgi:hypothetical protein